MSKLIIGISGKMGTGKSTLTNLLIKAMGKDKVKKMSLAAPIYTGQDLLYKEYGMTLDGEKDRDLLIAIGIWGRSKSPNFWLEQLAKCIIESDREIIICDDVRFKNEADFFAKQGLLFRIEGEQRGNNLDPSRANHATECDLDDYNFEHRLSNLGTPEDMCMQIAHVLKGGSDVSE